jgi:hypothetical protein
MGLIGAGSASASGDARNTSRQKAAKAAHNQSRRALIPAVWARRLRSQANTRDNAHMADWKAKLPQYWKSLAALVGAVLQLLNVLVGLQVWGATATEWIGVAISFITAGAVWLKRNVNVVERVTGVDIDQDEDVGEDG